MKFYDIYGFETLHSATDGKVIEIVESLEKSGWNGMPMLVDAWGYGQGKLVTGVHRFAALKYIQKELDHGDRYDEDEKLQEKMVNLINNTDVAEDVSDLIQDYKDENDIGDEDYFEMEYDSLGQYFGGTWVEEYADEIAEW